jgi:hypothetical protein
MTDLRVLSLWQPWATLWADPALPKTIETRPRPVPATIPLPAWVLIHAAARPVDHVTRVGSFGVYRQADACRMLHDRLGWVEVPLGAVVGAARITECLPIVEWADATPPAWAARGDDFILVRGAEAAAMVGPPSPRQDLTAELPYGDYTPGRWGYVTDRTVLFPEPIPWRGAQGWQRATPDLIAQTKEYLP